MYDVIIGGGGPAGLNAALYAARAGLKTLVLEEMFSGGQMTTTTTLENYIGFPGGIDAVDLAMKMEQQAKEAGAEIRYERISSLNFDGAIKQVSTGQETLLTKTFIACMGAKPRRLGIPGEDELRGRGVSYCATCDGALYKNKTTAVIGGGDTALEDALFLARYCQKVYLIHRRDSFRGVYALVEQVKKQPNIELILNTVATAILGEDKLCALSLQNKLNQAVTELPVDGLFIAVGTAPGNTLVKDLVHVNEQGYVVTNESMETNVAGVYAAGDLREKPLRQVITAAADGAVAAYSALRYIESNR